MQPATQVSSDTIIDRLTGRQELDEWTLDRVTEHERTHPGLVRAYRRSIALTAIGALSAVWFVVGMIVAGSKEFSQMSDPELWVSLTGIAALCTGLGTLVTMMIHNDFGLQAPKAHALPTLSLARLGDEDTMRLAVMVDDRELLSTPIDAGADTQDLAETVSAYKLAVEQVESRMSDAKVLAAGRSVEAKQLVADTGALVDHMIASR